MTSSSLRNATSRRKVRAFRLLLVLTAVSVLVAFHLLTLTRFPPAFVDEAWMASRAWGWLNTGLNFGSLDMGVHDQLDGYWTFFPWVPTLVHATAIKLLGLSLVSLRVTSLAFGVLLLVALYFVGRELTSSRACGFIAVLLVALSYPFTLSSHLVRPDIIVVALGFAAIGFHLLGFRLRRSWPAFVSGLLLGAAFETHLNAVIFVPPILAMYVFEDGWAFFRRRRFWAFVTGGGVSLVFYLWLHVVRYPETYLAMGGRLRRTHVPPLLEGQVVGVLRSLYETGSHLLLYTTGSAVAALIGLGWLARRRLAAKLIVMVVVAVVSFALLIRNQTFYYPILVSPFLSLLIAAWFDRLLLLPKPLRIPDRLAKLSGYMLVGISIMMTLALITLSPPVGEEKLVAAKVEAISQGKGSVMGPQTYWFDLTDHRYLSWQQILNYQSLHPKAALADAMTELSPDILVLDDHLRLFILSDMGEPPTSGLERYAWERRLPKKELDEFLACRGRLAGHVDTRAYGLVEVYAIKWDLTAGVCP